MQPDKKNIIRHPELTRLTDAQLLKEFSYEYEQSKNAGWVLFRYIDLIGIVISRKIDLPIPLYHLHEDFILHTDRLQAIREEIEFRKI